MVTEMVHPDILINCIIVVAAEKEYFHSWLIKYQLRCLVHTLLKQTTCLKVNFLKIAAVSPTQSSSFWSLKKI